MNAKRVNAAAGVIHGSQVNGKQTAAGIAADLESACMLQSPETAAELERLRVFADATTARHEAIRGLLGPVTITTPDAWDLGMAILAVLDGPGEGGPTADQRINDLKAQLAAKGQSIQAMVGERTKLLTQVAELEAERHSTNEALSDAAEALRLHRDRIDALVERLRAGQEWRRGRTPELVSENYVSQSELREIFGIPLVAPWGDEITRQIAPTQALREGDGVSPRVRQLRNMIAQQRAALEDPHDGPVRHTYRLGRDLPETGGVQ